MSRPRGFLHTILGVVIVAGCSEVPGTAPSPVQARILPPLSAFTVLAHPDLDKGPDGNLIGPSSLYLTCKPLKREKKDKDLDPKGGTLDIGPHSLVVPAGALPRKTKLTAEIVGDSVNSIRFTPEGLQFQTNTYLFMSYANCTKSPLDQVEVLYTTDDLAAILEQLPSYDDQPTTSVVGLVTHFSQYAVAF